MRRSFSPSFDIEGLLSAGGTLLDERGRPDFRDIFGALARRSGRILTAVTRVRITTLDLTEEEVAGITRFRVLLTELNALRLDTEAKVLVHHPKRAGTVLLLARLLEEERLQVRSAPLGGWSPDFTVFSPVNEPPVALLGYHWFERPYPHRGPALSTCFQGEGARLAARRHEELWENAHDVGPAVWSLLTRAARDVPRYLRLRTG